jgi:uncharacterized RDD family membrane protein YckC
MRANGAVSGWRRLLAFGLDYLVIAAYLGVLTGASFAVRRALHLGVRPPATMRERLAGHALAFLVLTVPVALYFAFGEASSRQATLGKRALRLRVVGAEGGRVPPGRALLRATVKFVPWECAHTALWHTPGIFTAAASPTAFTWVGTGLAYLLAGWYVVSLFVGSRRTPYDRAAGTRVVPA